MGVWVKVARSGLTVDGREILKQVIIDIVNNYHKNQLIMIYNEFNTLGLMLGQVINIKMETDSDGELALYAEIIYGALEKYIKQNLMETYLTIQYRNNGQYSELINLGATVNPAIVGLDPINNLF